MIAFAHCIIPAGPWSYFRTETISPVETIAEWATIQWSRIERTMRKLSLLIVADERNMLLLLDRVLSRNGYHVKSANNAEEALELVDRETFQLAVLNITMHPTDGFALLGEIRRRSPDTRVVMATGYPTVESREECIRRGASGYLIKPMDIPELKALLRRLAAL